MCVHTMNLCASDDIPFFFLFIPYNMLNGIPFFA